MEEKDQKKADEYFLKKSPDDDSSDEGNFKTPKSKNKQSNHAITETPATENKTYVGELTFGEDSTLEFPGFNDVTPQIIQDSSTIKKPRLEVPYGIGDNDGMAMTSTPLKLTDTATAATTTTPFKCLTSTPLSASSPYSSISSPSRLLPLSPSKNAHNNIHNIHNNSNSSSPNYLFVKNMTLTPKSKPQSTQLAKQQQQQQQQQQQEQSEEQERQLDQGDIENTPSPCLKLKPFHPTHKNYYYYQSVCSSSSKGNVLSPTTFSDKLDLN